MRRLVLLSLLLAAVAVVYPVWRWLQQDRCLDASGRWSAERRTCEF
jgi:hypothetical protein